MPALVLALLLPLAAVSPAQPASPDRDLVFRVRLENEAITPVVARFLSRALGEAEDAGASHFVIELDTPGGLVDSTRSIVRDLLGSSAKVVVYVSPSGARAASAGLFITLAADVAAMAPGTHIGAAHPVSVGGLPGGPSQPGEDGGQSVLEEKILNDTLAWARSLAELRGRNSEAAALAVSESRSFTESEALSEGLVDFVAQDLEELLARLDSEGAVVRTLEMGWDQGFLAALANPNLAFVLLLVGVYAIIFEFFSGGIGVAGILGAVCVILAFVGLAMLPLSLGGLALVVVGIGLLVAEAFVTSFGLLTLGGVACLILGGVMLVDSPPGFARVSTAVVVPVSIATGVVTAFLIGRTLRAHRAPVRTGAEALIGEVATAPETFVADGERYRGRVLLHGEYWTALSEAPVAAREEVTLYHRDGLVLWVHPVRSGPSAQGETT